MAPISQLIDSLVGRSSSSDVQEASTLSHIVRRGATAISPMELHTLHRRSTSTANFGSGSQPANEFNNKGFLALFALIGAGMTIGSIWFFFWAKNGGFKWRGKDDWDDYKSTVLRRKGPDGRTLSNATKSTRLGGGSVVHGGSYGAPTSVGYSDTSSNIDEKDHVRAGEGIRGGDGRRQKRNRKGKDRELAEYRHEKSARVGGLNRASDGAYFDYSNTEPSELGTEVSAAPLVKESAKDKKKAKKEAEQREKERKQAAKEAAKREKEQAAKDKKREKAKAKEQKKEKDKKESSYAAAKGKSSSPETTPRRTAPSAAYSFTHGDDRTEVGSGYTASDTYTNPSNADSYYSAYRPHAAAANLARPVPAARAYESPRHSSRNSPSHSRQSSPRKHAQHRSRSHSRHHSRSRPGSHSDIFDTNSDTGTKVYPCHIPGLSARTVVPEESVSQVGANSGGRRGRDVMDGYRRSRGRGRRDSLSDSDNDY